jgi:hypothetical protein
MLAWDSWLATILAGDEGLGLFWYAFCSIYSTLNQIGAGQYWV